METLKRVSRFFAFCRPRRFAAQAAGEPPRPEYGPDITIEQAKKIAAGASPNARRTSGTWPWPS